MRIAAHRSNLLEVLNLRSALTSVRLEPWLLVVLTCAALASRLFTNLLYAGEPTSDEYYYGLYAVELARAWRGASSLDADALGADGRFVTLLVAAALSAVPLDAIALGRLLQATFNALTVPLLYMVGRMVGLSWQASFAAAALFLAMPETWETAWRFWPDSQATFLAVATLLALLHVQDRPRLWKALVAVVLLLSTFLTKEYVGVATLPSLGAAGGLMLLSGMAARQRTRAQAVQVSLLLVVVPALVVSVLVVATPRVLSMLEPTWLYGPLSRTWLATDKLLSQAPSIGANVPEYLAALDRVFSPQEFSSGFVAFWALGAVGLVAVSMRSLWSWRPSPGRLRQSVTWLFALAAWAPPALFGWALAREAVVDSVATATLLLIGAALVAVDGLGEPSGARHVTLDPSAPRLRLPNGLAATGAFVTSFVVLRYFVWDAPDLRAAFTPRSFQPAFPVLALLSGWGLAATAGALSSALGRVGVGAVTIARGLVPRPDATAARAGDKSPRYGALRSEWAASVGPHVMFAALVATSLVWFAPARDHLGAVSLLHHRADREGDLATPGGLRITALVEAERWLEANVLPTDRVLTSMPRQLAWYARTGVSGYLNAVATADLSRQWPERRAKIMALLERPSEFDYVIDFNLSWTQPDSDDARQWYAMYRWLQTRSYLEEVYTRRDPNGRVAFYAFRNHRWAMSPSYVDREAARAIQLSAQSSSR